MQSKGGEEPCCCNSQWTAQVQPAAGLTQERMGQDHRARREEQQDIPFSLVVVYDPNTTIGWKSVLERSDCIKEVIIFIATVTYRLLILKQDYRALIWCFKLVLGGERERERNTHTQKKHLERGWNNLGGLLCHVTHNSFPSTICLCTFSKLTNKQKSHKKR